MSETNRVMENLRGDRTKRQVAKELGIPYSTYKMIETGHRFPRKDLQAKLARYFGTTVDDLFFASDCHESRLNGQSSA